MVFYICFRTAPARLNYLWLYFSPCDDKYDLPGVLQVGRSSGDFPGQISMITAAGRILAEIEILRKLIWPEWEFQPDSNLTYELMSSSRVVTEVSVAMTYDSD